MKFDAFYYFAIYYYLYYYYLLFYMVRDRSEFVKRRMQVTITESRQHRIVLSIPSKSSGLPSPLALTSHRCAEANVSVGATVPERWLGVQFLTADSLNQSQVVQPHARRPVVPLAEDILPEGGGLAQTAAGRLQTRPVLEQHALRVAVQAKRCPPADDTGVRRAARDPLQRRPEHTTQRHGTHRTAQNRKPRQSVARHDSPWNGTASRIRYVIAC